MTPSRCAALPLLQPAGRGDTLPRALLGSLLYNVRHPLFVTQPTADFGRGIADF